MKRTDALKRGSIVGIKVVSFFCRHSDLGAPSSN